MVGHLRRKRKQWETGTSPVGHNKNLWFLDKSEVRRIRKMTL